MLVPLVLHQNISITTFCVAAKPSATSCGWSNVAKGCLQADGDTDLCALHLRSMVLTLHLYGQEIHIGKKVFNYAAVPLPYSSVAQIDN